MPAGKSVTKAKCPVDTNPGASCTPSSQGTPVAAKGSPAAARGHLQQPGDTCRSQGSPTPPSSQGDTCISQGTPAPPNSQGDTCINQGIPAPPSSQAGKVL